MFGFFCSFGSKLKIYVIKLLSSGFFLCIFSLQIPETNQLISFLLLNSEKSIIKTLQSQQKQFTEEKRRREERNESILRSLERIDYQAKLLAANSERLRALKVNIKFTNYSRAPAVSHFFHLESALIYLECFTPRSIDLPDVTNPFYYLLAWIFLSGIQFKSFSRIYKNI